MSRKAFSGITDNRRYIIYINIYIYWYFIIHGSQWYWGDWGVYQWGMSPSSHYWNYYFGISFKALQSIKLLLIEYSVVITCPCVPAYSHLPPTVGCSKSDLCSTKKVEDNSFVIPEWISAHTKCFHTKPWVPKVFTTRALWYAYTTEHNTWYKLELWSSLVFHIGIMASR